MTNEPPMPLPFHVDLAAVINRHSRENDSNTPDFILAGVLTRCLEAWNQGIFERESWYGRREQPGVRDSDEVTITRLRALLRWAMDGVELGIWLTNERRGDYETWRCCGCPEEHYQQLNTRNRDTAEKGFVHAPDCKYKAALAELDTTTPAGCANRVAELEDEPVRCGTFEAGEAAQAAREAVLHGSRPEGEALRVVVPPGRVIVITPYAVGSEYRVRIHIEFDEVVSHARFCPRGCTAVHTAPMLLVVYDGETALPQLGRCNAMVLDAEQAEKLPGVPAQVP